MGVLFTLTPAIRQVTQQALDDLLDELAKDCKLYYTPTKEFCGCDGNFLLNGVQVPTPLVSVCPQCGGTGYREVEHTETIQMSVAVKPDQFWIKVPGKLQIPDGMIQTKCYIEDVIKIKRAKEMELQPELDAVVRNRYMLASEPVDISSIVQGRYFISIWQRVQ